MKFYVSIVQYSRTEVSEIQGTKVKDLDFFEIGIKIEPGQEEKEHVTKEDIEEVIFTRLQNLQIPGIENFTAQKARELSDGVGVINVLKEMRKVASFRYKKLIWKKELTEAEKMHLRGKGFHVVDYSYMDDEGVKENKYEINWDETN